MSVTFLVDDVPVCNRLLKTKDNFSESIKDICKVLPEAFGVDCNTSLVHPIVTKAFDKNAKMNGFIKAIHEAYANHYPLELSPDDVWLAIAQGFSYHVNANAEEFRSSFVKHEGKEVIRVRRDDFVKGSSQNDWPSCFSEFSKCISEYIGEDKRNILVSDFSTSTLIHRAVSEVTMMNTLKSYFQYVVLTKCGIPNITLTGTKEDWEKISFKVDNLRQFKCNEWCDYLKLILNNFIIAFDGNVDKSFWTNIYKINGPQGSGGTTISGWVNAFFPYINSWRSPGNFDLKNSSCSVTSNYGKSPDNYPLGLTSTPFIWEYLGNNFEMQFLAGFVGTSQDPDSKSIRPVQGWGVAST